VELTGADLVSAGFTAPDVPDGTMLTFQVAVSDGTNSASDQVNIAVRVDGTTTGGSSGEPKQEPLVIHDGCGCSVVGDSTNLQLAPLAAAAAAALLRRRRRRGGRSAS
jgi:MYXO-CTERM domain-containing protein